MSPKPIGIILLLGLVVLALNSTSFCYSRLRFVPDRELFENAIANQAHRMGDYSPPETPAAYLEKNPDCCSIAKFQPTNELLDLMFGNRIRYVRVVFRRPQAELDKYPNSEEFYEAFVEVTPCGKAMRAIGTTTNYRTES